MSYPAPALYAPSGISLSSVAAAIEASLLSESLYEFVKAAWHVVEPGTKFVDNWHIKAICDHVEDLKPVGEFMGESGR